MNKAYLQETPSTWNDGQAPLPGFINFSYCGKRVNFSRVSKSQKEWGRTLFGTHLATKSPYFLVKLHKKPQALALTKIHKNLKNIRI